MNFWKTITLCLGVILASTLIFVGVSSAQSFKTGDTVGVAANETIDSMLFITGKNVNIVGTVNGDVYCAGGTVDVSGTINGDLICGAQTITVSGVIDGNVRLGGQTITISGTIRNSVTIGAQNLVIDKDAIIGRDLLGGIQVATINGSIGRDVLAGTQNITINGEVGRDFKGGTENFTVGSAGSILGNVDYTSNNEVNIVSGGKIAGTVKRTETPVKTENTSFSPFAFTIGWFIYSFVALLITALVLVGLFPRIFKEAAASAKKKPGTTALVGIAAAFVTPIVIVLLMITVIGIPLALLILLGWLIAAVLSGPFASYMLGKLIMPESKSVIWVMLVGGALLIVTFFIPILGFVTMLVSYLFGMGMVASRGRWLLLRK